MTLQDRLARDGYALRRPVQQPGEGLSSMTGLADYGCTVSFDRWQMVPTFGQLFTMAERKGMRMSKDEVKKVKKLTIRADCERTAAKAA